MNVQAHLEELDDQGYTLIREFLSADALRRVRDGLAPYLDSHHGRNAFEGFRTERVYTLVGRGRVFEDIVEDARVLAILDRLLRPGYLLTASQAICIHPGETAQPIHHDDSFYPVPRPRPSYSYSTIVAVDDFTRGERRHRGHPRQSSVERRADRRPLRRPAARTRDAGVARVAAGADGGAGRDLHPVPRHIDAQRRREPQRSVAPRVLEPVL